MLRMAIGLSVGPPVCMCCNGYIGELRPTRLFDGYGNRLKLIRVEWWLDG